MAIKTQGTRLFTVDPANDTVIAVGCITSLDGIDTTQEQIETTCLEALARTYEAGLATPGQASFGINFDPQDATHTRLHELKKQGTTLPWAVGFSDGVEVLPTVDSAGNFELGTGRSWIKFEGFMTSFPFNFALNSVLQSTVAIQISGDPDLFKKSA